MGRMFSVGLGGRGLWGLGIVRAARGDGVRRLLCRSRCRFWEADARGLWAGLFRRKSAGWVLGLSWLVLLFENLGKFGIVCAAGVFLAQMGKKSKQKMGQKMENGFWGG